ncbi:MAG: methylmalonyl Co-A mutase-associated GTPase MeaB [Ginsengibacter sp.]
MWQHLLQQLISGNAKALARCISLVENEVSGYDELMEQLPGDTSVHIIGITGAPGAGKSTLADALIGSLVADDKKVGVLCVDPSSPFNMGALLGDRIRMSEWYNNPNVFIRSLATRGSLGGLTPKIIEITELMKAAGFDYIIIETVGVGQSEIEIAGIADTTIVVLMPSSGDEIQTMKAGVMEIADIFVVNKSDNPGANVFVKNLLMNMKRVFSNNAHEVSIIKTIATEKKGIEELKEKILEQFASVLSEKKYLLLTEKAYQLIQNKRMKDVNKKMLREEIMKNYSTKFNLYAFIKYFDELYSAHDNIQY